MSSTRRLRTFQRAVWFGSAWLFAASAWLPTRLDAQAPVALRYRQLNTNSVAFGVAVDASGNVYMTGWGSGSMLGQTPIGNLDGFLVKYNAAGDLQWIRQFGTPSEDRASSIALDSSGDVYVAGYTTSALPGFSFLGGFADAFVLKYNSAGALQWTRQFGTSSSDEARGVAVDTTGVYAGGFTEGALEGPAIGFRSAFVRKYDINGNVQWTRQFGPTGNTITSVVSMSARNGFIFAGGSTSATLPGPNVSSGGQDAFVLRYDANGNVLWTRQFGTAANDTLYGVSASGDGAAFAVTQTDGTSYIHRYNASGVNDPPIPIASATAVAADESGGGATVARFRNSSTTDLGATRVAGGSVVWEFAQDLLDGEDLAWAIAAGAGGTVYLAGSTDANIDGSNPGNNQTAVLAWLVPNTPTSSPASLTFNGTAGGTAPAPQQFTVTTPIPGAGYNLGATTQSGGNWLSVNPASGITPTQHSVSVNTVGLAAGTYSGSLQSATSGAPLSVPVTLNLAASCSYNINPAQASLPAQSSSNNSLSITAPPGCAWTIAAASVPAWVTIQTPASLQGSGSGAVSYSVQANATFSTRTANLTIAGQTYTVNQAAASCSYGLSAPSQAFPASGGSGTVTVTPSLPACQWAITNVPPTWITIQAPANLQGTGAGPVTFSVQANQTPSARQATLVISGQAYTVTQEGACAYAVSPSSVTGIGPGGASGSIQVTTSTTCTWVPISQSPWIAISGSGAGGGPGTVTYTVAANSGAGREGTILIGSQIVQVQQIGASECVVTLSPQSALLTGAAGAGTFQVSAPCSFTAVSEAPWVQVTSGAQGAGTGTVGYRVDALGAGSRTGTVSVNGTRFFLSQNAASCTLTVSPMTLAALSGGGTQFANVTNPGGCAWTAVSTDAWITVTSGGNGSLTGNVALSIQPNTGTARNGSVTIAGQRVTVSQQAGNTCQAALVPDKAVYRWTGGQGQLEVNTPCAWTAVSGDSWIRIVSGVSATGTGAVLFTLAPNPGASSRTGTLLIAGQTFVVTQQGQGCEYSLSAQSLASPPEGADLRIAVTAAAGCAWTASESLDWAGIVSGGSGSGNGMVTIRVQPQPAGGLPRNGELTIAQRLVRVTQEGSAAFACTAEVAGAPRQVRVEGAAELTSDLLLRCGGAAARAFSGSVTVRLNTSLASRVLTPFGSNVEALLVVGTPASLVPGQNVFGGSLIGGDSVRFTGIPLARQGANAIQTYRILNLRADASVPNLGGDIVAAVEAQGDLNVVSVRAAAPLVIAQSRRSLETTFGAASGSGDITLPVTFRELTASAFRVRQVAGEDPGQPGIESASESGFMNTSLLGPAVGVANSATRLLVRLRGIPPGARVFAPGAVSAGASAQLITTDRFGAALGSLGDSTLIEVPAVDGQVTLTWEITAANPSSPELLTFPLVFRGTTAAMVDQIRTVSQASFAPLPLGAAAGAFATQPVPRFSDPLVNRPRLNTRVRAAVEGASPAAFRQLPFRAPTGNRTYLVPVETANDSSVPAEGVVVRGNVSAGSSFQSARCDAGRSGASCAVDGEDFVVRYPRLDPGELVTATIGAEIRFDAPNASEVRLEVSVASDYSTTSDALERCLPAVSSIPSPSGDGATGTISIWACGPWRISSSVPWIRFNVSEAHGNAEITYTVDANTTATTRSGAVSLPDGRQVTVEQQRARTLGSPAGLRFVPITPCRLLETRPLYAGNTWTGAGGPPGLSAGVERTLPVSNSRCNIPASARAFVLNVTTDTVFANTGPVDFLTIWPNGEARPDFWTLRTSTGGYVANSAIVKAGTDGAIKLYSSDNLNLVVDISGYFTADASGLLFYPTASCRPVDTRSIPAYTAGLPPPFGNQRMQAQETRTLRLPASTRCQIPAAQAYSMQFTLTPGAEADGNPVAYLSAWNTGGGEPPVSNLNSLSGSVMSNSAIVPARSDGSIDVKTFNATNFLADVNGYFGPEDNTGRGLLYYPVTQCRVMNTTDATLPAPFGPPRMAPDADREITLATSTRCPGLPATAKAWALNVTAIPSGTPLAFLSLWAGGSGWPAISQLNAFQGQTVSNSAIVPGSATGGILVKVTNPTHVALEVAGYFAR